MEFSGSLPVASRHTLIVLGVAALLCATSNVRAQQTQGQPPAQTPAPAPQAGPTPEEQFTFPNRDVVIVMNQIKPDQTANFESAWAAIKDKLSKSDKPELKQLGDSIVIYKLDVPLTPPDPTKPVVYLFYLAPPSKALSYYPTAIIYKSGAFGPVDTMTPAQRAEADAIFAKLKDCYVATVPWPLAKVGG
jgi:hypothetical protein